MITCPITHTVNGVLITFYRAIGFALTNNGTVTYTVGGWGSQSDSFRQDPLFTQSVDVLYPVWTPSLYDSVDSVVNAHPVWAGGTTPPNKIWKPGPSTIGGDLTSDSLSQSSSEGQLDSSSVSSDLGGEATAGTSASGATTTGSWVNDPARIVTVATWDTLVIVANGISAATLGPALPNPSTVTITPPVGLGIADIADQTVTDGTFVLTTTVPGDYAVKVSAINYYDYEVTISAT